MNLGSRLEAALEFISQTENNLLFADIGSDHAFLPIEAIKRGFAQNAIAADINILPLEKGKENAEKQGIDLEFILSDGFDSFDQREITSAAICGMGGELIAKAVLRSKAARKCLLVLQPMSAQEELRRALWDNGFEIIQEKFVIDSGKPYTVIKAKYSEKSSEYTFTDLYLGKERSDSPEFSEYCKKIMNAASKRRLGIIATHGDTNDIDSLINECQTHITSF